MKASDQNVHSVAAAAGPVVIDDISVGAVQPHHAWGRVCKIVKQPVTKEIAIPAGAVERDLK